MFHQDLKRTHEQLHDMLLPGKLLPGDLLLGPEPPVEKHWKVTVGFLKVLQTTAEQAAHHKTSVCVSLTCKK